MKVNISRRNSISNVEKYMPAILINRTSLEWSIIKNKAIGINIPITLYPKLRDVPRMFWAFQKNTRLNYPAIGQIAALTESARFNSSYRHNQNAGFENRVHARPSTFKSSHCNASAFPASSLTETFNCTA